MSVRADPANRLGGEVIRNYNFKRVYLKTFLNLV